MSTETATGVMVRLTAVAGQSASLAGAVRDLYDAHAEAEAALIAAAAHRVDGHPDEVFAYELWERGQVDFVLDRRTARTFPAESARVERLIASRKVARFDGPSVRLGPTDSTINPRRYGT